MECSEFKVYLLTLYLLASILSFLGSLVVFVLIAYTKLYYSYSFKILMMISLNDLMRAVLGILINFFKESKIFCIFTGYIFDCNSFSNNIWAVCIIFTLYQIVVKEQTNFMRHDKIWMILAFPFTFLIQAIPLLTSSYGLNEDYCELKFDFFGKIWRFALFYMPILFGISFSIFLTIKVYNKLLKINSFTMTALVFERGLIYAIILGVVEIPLMIIRIIQIFHNTCNMFYIVLAFFFLFQLQGFANSLVFISNKTVRTVLFKKEPEVVVNTFTRESLNISFRSTFS